MRIERDRRAGFGRKGLVPGHALVPIRAGVRTAVALVAARYVSELPRSRRHVLDVNLHLDMQRIVLADVRMPTRITQRPRWHCAYLRPQKEQLAISETLQQIDPARMVDQVDEDIVFL